MTAFVVALLKLIFLLCRIAIWLGSMMFFSFSVAPSAFAVLPTREHADGGHEHDRVIGPILMIIRAALPPRLIQAAFGFCASYYLAQ